MMDDIAKFINNKIDMISKDLVSKELWETLNLVLNNLNHETRYEFYKIIFSEMLTLVKLSRNEEDRIAIKTIESIIITLNKFDEKLERN